MSPHIYDLVVVLRLSLVESVHVGLPLSGKPTVSNDFIWFTQVVHHNSRLFRGGEREEGVMLYVLIVVVGRLHGKHPHSLVSAAFVLYLCLGDDH